MSQYTGATPDTARAADWRDRALCALPANRGIDWFPHPTDAQGIAKAKAVCADCPVRQACLDSALLEEGAQHRENRHGIRGGLDGQARRSAYERANRSRLKGMWEQAPQPRVARCGTYSGYQKHLREKTLACPECREAKREANRKQKRNRSPIQCGTRPGYQRHQRNGETPCEPCRIANTKADRRLRNTGTTLAPS